MAFVLWQVHLPQKAQAANEPSYAYGSNSSDCEGSIVVNKAKSSTIYKTTACLRLSPDKNTYVSASAPAGNAVCPDKNLGSKPQDQGVRGIAASQGGTVKCFYFKSLSSSENPVIGPPALATRPSGTGGDECPEVSTIGLRGNINCANKNPIYALLEFVINWAIRLLGVLAVIAIIISGIQYITSQGNPDGIKQAKSRLVNAVVGLILLSLMFVILRLIGVG